MNWLAHVLLSEPVPAFRIGNLLPDLMSYSQLAAVPSDFRPGILRHREIDAFTDSHPIVRRSVRRFDPPLRRFGGVLVDLFYDHFLALHWSTYCEVPFRDFLQNVYDDFNGASGSLPDEVRGWLRGIGERDLFGSYGGIEGVRAALIRMERRFRRPVALVPAIPVLEREYDLFEADFTDFFPALAKACASGQFLCNIG